MHSLVLASSQHLVNILVLEPLAGHRVLLDVPLHGLDIDVVAGVQDVQLLHDTGHVADLGLH